MSTELLTIPEAAEAMGLPRTTAEGYLRSGRVPGVRTVGGELRVSYASIAPLTARFRHEVLEPLADIEAEIEAGEEVRATDLLRAVAIRVEQALRTDASKYDVPRFIVAAAVDVGLGADAAWSAIKRARAAEVAA